jgi:NAD(P)H-dependent FMN reductase
MTLLYRQIMTCDCLLFGTPIYFDSMSAQSKLFVDRCNCLRPANFADPTAGDGFVKRIDRRRSGAIVLVGGDKAWFEGARRPLAGYFKWIGVNNEATLTFTSKDVNRIGEVADNDQALAEAARIGQKLARKIK